MPAPADRRARPPRVDIVLPEERRRDVAAQAHPGPQGQRLADRARLPCAATTAAWTCTSKYCYLPASSTLMTGARVAGERRVAFFHVKHEVEPARRASSGRRRALTSAPRPLSTPRGSGTLRLTLWRTDGLAGRLEARSRPSKPRAWPAETRTRAGSIRNFSHMSTGLSRMM